MRRSSRILLSVASTVLILASLKTPCWAQKVAIHTSKSPLKPKEAAQTMIVPEGVRVTLFAGEPDVMQPIGFCMDDRGRLWVLEAYSYPVHSDNGRDRIVIFEDTDGDGRHDKRTVFYDKLNYVSGIEVGFGGVWVMSPPSMFFIPDADGDDVPDAPPTVVLDGFGTHANAHNIANGFAWGPDGWLYATHGRTNWSLIGRPGADESERQRFDGGVWRYHPVRDVWEPYADGTTNPWGIDWNDLGDAFVTNCVNPHLFQVIQGAHYEPWRGRKSSQYAYQRIETIADHLHFVGLSNVRKGLGSDAEDSAGGGHAHCGTMIYLGDLFPPEYRNQLFTNNIHGRRINQDRLRQSGSGYVASHGTDLLRSRDPWFMGVTLACGPSGEIFVSDWSDTGECHSTRNTRRHTGRIYRLTFLEDDMPTIDLRGTSDDDLVAMQLENNDWRVRHARRRLQERAATGADMRKPHIALRKMLDQQPESPKRLRALWALHVTGGLDEDALMELLEDRDENLRAWAITLICEDRDPPPSALDRMIELAVHGTSPRVRLALASACQRLSPAAAWPIVQSLASRGEDAEDANLPLMTWYAAEPLLENSDEGNVERFVALASQTTLGRVAENASRRTLDSPRFRSDGLRQLIASLPSAVHAKAILRGILLGLEGQRQPHAPKGWTDAYAQLIASDDPELATLAIQLAMVFRDPEAIEQLLSTVADASLGAGLRRSALEALAENRIAQLEARLVPLMDDQSLRESALRAMARYLHPKTETAILSNYASFSPSEKQAAIRTLSTRRDWARGLMGALENGDIDPGDITAFAARQLKAVGDDEIHQALKRHWGEVRDSPANAAKQIAAFRKGLTREALAGADLANGKRLFQQHCGNCHQFFGEGGRIGPDLTGSQRTNLTYLLENVVDPSASVAKDYRMSMVQTIDGRVVSGLIERETSEAVTLVTGTDRHVIPIEEIEVRKLANTSVMPTGLLEPLSEREIRDLIGYLQK